MAMLLNIYVLGLFLPAVLSGTCTLTENQNGGSIYCTKITQEKYVSSIFEFGPRIEDIVNRNATSRFSIAIFNSYLPKITEWIYVPWQYIGQPFSYVDLVKSLVIFNSSVREVNFTSNSNGIRVLETLDLGGNNISDYSFLSKIRLENLHVSHSNLYFNNRSFLYNYYLTNSDLKLVNFSHCDVTSFTVANNKNLDLSYNLLLHTIEMHYVYPIPNTLNIEGSYNLKKVNFGVSNLIMSNLKSYFNFSLLTNITTNNLVVRDNNIYRLDTVVFVLHKIIYYIYPTQPSIDLTNTKLNFISGAYFRKYSLNSLNLSKNYLTKLTNYTFRDSTIDNLDISKSQVDYIDSTVFYGLRVIKLDLSKNGLRTLENVFSNITSISELNLAFNPIKYIGKNTFSNCTSLQVLNLTNCYLRRNGFSTKSFVHLINLKHLELSFTGTFDANRIKNYFLETLVIRNSNLTLLENNFRTFYNLKYLYFPNTNINNISIQALQGLFSLKEIDSKNLLSSLSYTPIFYNLSSLIILNITYSNIQKLNSSDFGGLTHLKTLNASFNSISKIDVHAFQALNNLEVLALSHNALLELPIGIFSNVRNLTHLYLNNNKIRSIKGIVSMDHLIFLDISYNYLTQQDPNFRPRFPVFPHNLKYLLIQSNQIDYYYMNQILENFLALEQVDINYNDGTCANLNIVLLYLERHGIDYKPLNPIFDTANINGVSCSYEW